MAQKPQSAWRPGDAVLARGYPWQVLESRGYPGCALIRLDGLGLENRHVTRTLILPFDRIQTLARDGRLRAVRRRRWMAALGRLAIGAARVHQLRAASPARIDLLAYQLEPALAVARGASRVLLADEVGLGKTIQAGLIAAELIARGLAEHILFVVPPGLRDQWRDELQRFSLEAAVMDATALRRLVAELPAGLNPWVAAPIAIASADFVKRPEILNALLPIAWDLVVVDEAHGAPEGCDRGAAVRALARRARRVVLLTATPHAGDANAFHSLCAIGALGDREPVGMFRRSRGDVGLAVRRRVHLLAVAPTAEERRMHDLLNRYARDVWREAGPSRDARLAVTVLLKRSLSSAASLASSVERRLEALEHLAAGSIEQLVLPLDEAGAEDDDVADAAWHPALAAPGLADASREIERLVAVRDAARVARSVESKIARLIRIVERLGEPAIVFTEYRDTLARLADALSPIHAVATLHGGMTRVERRGAVEAFESGRASLLIATDAAGEGLNLQARCRLVINLELPWNPMRLEQRIGRVDRLGQSRTVHAINLLARDTPETAILARLAVRLQRARESLGDINDPIGRIDELLVADWIVAGVPLDPRAPDTPPMGATVVTPGDTRLDAVAETARQVTVRRLAEAGRRCSGSGRGPAADLETSAPWLTVIPRARTGRRSHERLPAGLVCVYRARILDGAGRLLEDVLTPIHLPARIDLRPLGGEDRPEGLHRRQLVRAAVDDRLAPVLPRLESIATRAAAERLVHMQAAHAAAVIAARARETAITEHQADALANASEAQRGLFDRRADRHADQTRTLAEIRAADTSLRLSRLDASLDITLGGSAELLLVLVITS